MLHEQRFTLRKLARRLQLVEKLVHRRREPLAPFRLRELGSPEEPPPLGEDSSGWPVLEPLQYWGRWRMDFLLRTTLRVPADWEGPLALQLPLGEAGDFSHPECLVYLDGQAYAACDRHHQEIQLPGTLQDGVEHRLELHGWTGMGGHHLGDPGRRLLMRECALVRPDLPTREFLALARVAHGIAQHMERNAPERGRILNALDHAFLVLDTREPFDDRFYASVPRALGALRSGLEKAGAPLSVEMLATGHAHIDVAWLWPLGQTRRKAGRTFHTVLRLMEQFPDYHFTQSQPQLYDYVRQDYPELFEAIRQRVKEGRWEATGGMWVEADANLSGSESLARQFVLGRSFFRRHFGAEAETPVMFLPDVFGYSAALPQLIKQAGLQYFFTIKIGWSQYNRLPYDSFWWQGLDGTRVLTHFSTSPDLSGNHASTYNSSAVPEQVLGCWTTFKQKELQNHVLMLYGHGDGGGGPTREMLENLRELRAFPGAPQARQASVGSFFQRLEEQSGDRLPVWNGELYLELHRGTYTTQGANKRGNRKSEVLLHDAEFLGTWAWLLGGAYPDLARAWELVCLNQFHDILPGSSIREVYVDSLRDYAEVASLGSAAVEAAVSTLAARWGGDVLVLNPTGFTRRDVVFLAGPVPPGLRTAGGAPVAIQPAEGGCWLGLELLPYCVTPLVIGDEPAPAVRGVTAGEWFLENAYVRVELTPDGDVSRIYDKVRAREVMSAPSSLQCFEDRPMDWEAWDVDIFYDDKMWTASPGSLRVLEQGPLRASIEVRRQVLSSSLVQRIVLCHDSARLDFETEVDWRERHIFLKAAFPVEVMAREASFDVQWGQVTRPTHRNTSWDWARFETCAHKWADLSEADYGVSLLNDCKYGHDVRDNVLRLSLLRSSTAPDPEADQGEHRFTYSLLPHTGPVGPLTCAAAYALNDPLRAVRSTGQPPPEQPGSLLSCDNPCVILETVKRSEDGTAVVVRLFESQRTRGVVRVFCGFPVASAERVNLLEEAGEPLELDGNTICFPIKPFEIVTLKLQTA